MKSSHLFKEPIPPGRVVDGVPEALDRLVLDLLSGTTAGVCDYDRRVPGAASRSAPG